MYMQHQPRRIEGLTSGQEIKKLVGFTFGVVWLIRLIIVHPFLEVSDMVRRATTTRTIV